MSSNPDKEERISVEGFSKYQRSLRDLLIYKKIRETYKLSLQKTMPKMIESKKKKE